MFSLQIQPTTGNPQTIQLRPGKTSIGRDLDNLIILQNDSQVSRHHAVIEVAGDLCTILDLKSLNGTFLGDSQLLRGVPERWSLDKAVRIGHHLLTLSFSAEQAQEQTQFAPQTPVTPAPSNKGEPQVDRSNVSHPISATLELTLEPATLAINVGVPVTTRLTVINLGDRVEHLYLTVEGIPSHWVQAPQPLVKLNPHKVETVTLTIHPDHTPVTGAGQATLHLRVASSDGKTAATCEALLTLSGQPQPVIAYDLLLHPPRRTSSHQGTFQIQVTNRSQAELTLTFTATDIDEFCRFTFTPARLRLSAGGEEMVRLTVQAKRPLSGNDARAAPFTVIATPVAAPEMMRRVHGEWVQAPPAFDLALDNRQRSGTTHGSYQVRVTNRSESSLALRLRAGDDEGQCAYTLQPTEIQLAASQEGAVQLTMQPKTPPTGGQAVIFPFWVEAHPTAEPQLVKRSEGRWTCVPPTFDLFLQPPQQRDTGQSQFVVQIQNRSPGAFTARLSLTEDNPGCQWTFAQPTLTVAQDQRVATQLTVKPCTVNWGEAKSYPFTVMAHTPQDADNPQQVCGEYIQSRHWGCLFWLGLGALFLFWLLVAR